MTACHKYDKHYLFKGGNILIFEFEKLSRWWCGQSCLGHSDGPGVADSLGLFTVHGSIAYFLS